jgi:hypothetical protein
VLDQRWCKFSYVKDLANCMKSSGEPIVYVIQYNSFHLYSYTMEPMVLDQRWRKLCLIKGGLIGFRSKFEQAVLRLVVPAM